MDGASALATVDDLRARWPGPGEVDEQRAEAAIGDATAYILAAVRGLYDPDDALHAAAVRTVCCSMALRALSAGQGDAGFGVTQFSQTATSFTESRSFQNPTGDLYFTSGERKMLAQAMGVGRSRIWAVEPEIGWGAEG